MKQNIAGSWAAAMLTLFVMDSSASANSAKSPPALFDPVSADGPVLETLDRSPGETPKLIEDKAPEICGGYLKALRAAYSSSNRFISPVDGLHEWGARELFNLVNAYSNDPPTGARPMDFKARDQFLSNYASIHVDLDGDGADDRLVVEWHEHSWRGYNYGLASFSSSEASKIDMLMREGDGSELRKLFEAAIVKGAARRAPWSPPILLEAPEGGVFYVRQSSSLFEPEPSLSRITLSGAEIVCSAALTTPVADDAVAHFARIASLAQGEECDGGTLHALSDLQLANEVNFRNIQSRPWAISAAAYDPPEKLNSMLETWSYIDPWSRNVYLQMIDTAPKAKKTLAARLERDFGARGSSAGRVKAANSLFYSVFGSYFVFGVNGASRLQRQGALMDGLRARLYREEASVAELAAADTPASPDFLFAAVMSPQYIRPLVEHGADVNAGNRYGKTALMYAAHLDRLGAAKALIALGADVNRGTVDAKTDYRTCGSPGVMGRTALAYAAENASFEMNMLLLRTGADPDVGVGRERILGMLSTNDRLTARERKRIEKMIANSPISASSDKR